MLHFRSIASDRRAWAIGLLLIVGVLTGGAFWYIRSAASADTSAADANGVNILLGLADSAMHDGRLVAPEGSNAYEFYFSVLQLEPHNQVALDNLKKAFVPACDEVERLINPVDLDEAQRELSLLREYDATNYTLALLGGKLSAQRTLLTRQHEAQAARIQSQQEAAATQ
jgi:periplasmic protein TonB